MTNAIPNTVSELIDWFENNFECFTGRPRAFFEIQLNPEFSCGGKVNPVVRGIYEVHAIKTKDEANAERNLVQAMRWDFAPLAGAGHALFWRLPEKIVLKQNVLQECGRLVATREVIEDNALTTPPDGCVMNYDGNWYEDAGTSQEWVLRTRLCIPAASWIVMPPMITKKTEGLRALSI